MNNVITRFEGHWDFLSNSYPNPVMFAGMAFPTVENAYQAAKTLEDSERVALTHCDPSTAKQRGHSFSLRPNWERLKDDIMRGLLQQKFVKGTSLAEELIRTEKAFICHLNRRHDNYWGACDCDKCLNQSNENRLGVLLMRIRDELISQENPPAV